MNPLGSGYLDALIEEQTEGEDQADTPEEETDITVDAGSEYSLPNADGGTVAALAVDSDSDGDVDGFDLVGNTAPLELSVLVEVSDGVFEIDVDRDGQPDCYLIIDEDGNVTMNTAPDGSGQNVTLVMDIDGNFIGIDTDGDGEPDIVLGELNLTITVTTPGESAVTVSGEGTVLGEFDQMAVTAGLSGATSWIWYLDGELIVGATSDSYTVDCFTLGLGWGVHNLAVIAVAPDGSWSNQITFTVEN